MILRLNITDTSNALTILGKSFANISADLKSGQGFFYSIFGGNKYSNNDVKHLNNYIGLLKQGVPWNQAWNKEMSNTSILMRNNAHPIRNNIQALEELTVAQKTATFGAKALSLGMAALQAAMNVGVILLITKGIQLLSKAIDNYVHRVENAQERIEELNSEHKDLSDSYKEHKKLVEDVADSYTILAKEVNTANNQNISLSTEDYEEFLSMNEKIANAFPSLIKGYDDQGNAILNLGKNGQTAAADLRELLEVEEAIANQKIANTIDEYVDNAFVVYDSKDTAKTQQKNIQKDAQARLDAIESVQNIFSQDIFTFNDLDAGASEMLNMLRNSIAYIAKEYNLTLTDQEKILQQQLITDEFGNTITEYVFNSMLFDDKQIKDFQNHLNGQATTLTTSISEEYGKAEKQIQLLDSEIEANWGETLSNLTATMHNSWNYGQLSPDLQTLADNVLSELDASALPAINDQGAENYLLNNIILPLKNLPESERVKIEDLFTKELSTETYLQYVNEIQQYCDENGLTLPVEFIFNAEELRKEYEQAIHRFDSLDTTPTMLDRASAYNQLNAYNKNGLIDFTNRPVIKTDKLQAAGWGQQDAGFATVYSSAFSNEEGTQTVVVTPILPDGSVLSPEQLEEYANKILAGEQVDANITMGIFNGKNSIEQADEFAQKIHELHAILFPTSQSDILHNYFTNNPNIDPTYFNEVTAGAKDASDAINKYANSIKELNNISKEFSKLEMIDTINSMSDGFDILDNIYADVYDGETFDFTNLDSSKFEEAFSGLEKEYTNFIETISASPTDIDACQNAFDELTTAFVKQKGILSGVSEENKQLTIDMLENMGVINAEEVVLDVLAQKERNLAVETEKAALASQNLAMNSWDTINALVNEEGASDIAQIAMAQLALEKLKVNNITISTSKDIQQIINLANTALAGTEALAQLAKAKNVLAAVESAGSRERAGVSEKAFLEAQNIVQQLSEGTYDFQFNLIDTSKLLTQFGGASETAAAKQKNLEDATKSATDALEKEKQALEDLKSEYDELYDAIQWYFDKQIDDIDDKIDAINKENEALKKQKDNLDDILAAIENNYDYEISLIQDKIDKLQDANDEEEKAIALEEAKRKLQEARSRKTILLYQKGKGFTYVQDQKAIKESEEELEKLQEEAVIDELQDQIDKLEELKNKWSEIPEAYEKAMQELAAKKYFGDDWKNITLNPSDSLLNSFEGKYTGIQSTIDKNESKIEGLEAEKERIEELKELWEEAKNAYQYSQYEAKLSSFFGSDYEYQLLHNSAGWRRKFADEYSSICAEIEALEERIKASNENTATSTAESAEKVAGAAKKIGEAAKNIQFEIDTDVLSTAKEKLEQLDFQIGIGQQGLHGVRDAVAEFINNYEKADGCTTLTKELTDSVEALKGMYEGTGSSMEGAMSKVSSDIETFKVQSQTMSQNLTDVDEKLQSISSSESQVESNVNAELSEVDQTILNLKKNIDDLKLALQELETFKANLDTLVTTQTLDTSVLVADTMARVIEIQTAVSTLFVSLTTLTTALETLDGQMQTLDSYTLNNLIMALGQGGQEGEGGGSGLFAAIQNIITLLGNEETGLLYLLTLLNNSDLSTIIAAFNGEAGLLTAINQVASAIYIPDDSDGISLYSIINKLLETIPTVSTVRSSFSELVGTLAVCNSQVGALQKAIDELPIEKTITIKVVQEGTVPDLGGTGTAFAFGAGTAKFNSIKSGHAYAKGTGKWGLDKDHPNSLIGELKPEILLRDGEYHLIEDPTIMDLKKDDIIFNGDQTEDILKHGNRSNISRLEKLSQSAMQTMFGKSFGNGTASQMRLFELLQSGLPNSFYAGQAHIDAIKPLKASHGLYNKQEFSVTIGDIYVQGVDNANSLADDIIKNLPNIMLQKLNKR